METKLSHTEIEERVAILRRFRDALLNQRERFSRYLEMLEQYHPSGTDNGNSDPRQIEIHVEVEQAIVHEIASFERVIEPLQLMYLERDPDVATDLPKLRMALGRTRDEVLQRTVRNRELLRTEIGALRSEISGLRVMQRRQSLYATPEPTTIDLSA